MKVHYEFEDNKRITGASGAARSGSLTTDERRDTFATAVYVQNRYDIAKNWDVTVGLRVEQYRQGRQILKSVATQNVENHTALITEWIPGLGTTYTVSPETTLFAGVHRGFAPPKFADALYGSTVLDQKLEAERSWNYEAGIRTKAGDADVNVTAFFYDYQNQIVNAAQSSGFAKANAGQTQILGLETDISQEWVLSKDTSLYGTMTATYVDARSKSGTTDGNNLPYSPEYTGSWTAGIRHGNWDTSLEMVYVGNMFSDSANTLNGSADGETGEIPSHLVWNLSSRYTLDRMAFFGTIKNLFNTTYIASRRPEGIFPGTPQQLLVGMTVEI
jgi:Fe(3+) dicitrate transport protein